jgi:hypothetical protein
MMTKPTTKQATETSAAICLSVEESSTLTGSVAKFLFTDWVRPVFSDVAADWTTLAAAAAGGFAVLAAAVVPPPEPPPQEHSVCKQKKASTILRQILDLTSFI